MGENAIYSRWKWVMRWIPVPILCCNMDVETWCKLQEGTSFESASCKLKLAVVAQ
jgi:hypothetical protein